MAKKLVAAKHRGLKEPYTEWCTFHDYRYVIYGIESLGPVETTNGPMIKVKLKKRVELSDINQDVAAFVGHLRITGNLYDLYYWEDKYWLKALDSTAEWYKDQCYLLYEVDVQVTDDYIEALAIQRDTIAAAKS